MFILGTSCLLKKIGQPESCKLSFIWGKMQIVAWETAPQIALRNCSTEVGVRGRKGGRGGTGRTGLQIVRYFQELIL